MTTTTTDSNRPASLRSNNSTSPSPISTTPQRRVTVRSERSLPRKTNSVNLLNGGHSSSNEPTTIIGKISAIPSHLKLVLFATKINILLIFIPLGIISHVLHWPEVATFILNFIAIIPLAK
ncbi:hypothetical protein BGZ94_006609, partial [Podila epigama]